VSQPTPTVQVAFGVNPGTVPTIGQWTDISAYLSDLAALSSARGRSSETELFPPGAFAAMLKNRDRRFDPDNTSGPYYPNLKPMVRMRYGLGYLPLIFADVPVGYWRLGESSGTTATDELGSFNGTYNGSPTLGATGKIGGNTAVTFTAASSQSVTLASTSLRACEADCTYECWFKTTTGSNEGLLMEGASSSSNRYFALDHNGGFIRFNYSTNGGGGTIASATSVYADGQWHHAAVTKSGTAITLYADGVQVASGTLSGTFDVAYNQPAFAAYRKAGVLSNYLSGTLDEVAIYTRALTAAEILEHYNEGHSGLADGWRFTGFIERWPQTWPAKVNEAVVPITAIDGTIVLEAAQLPASVWDVEVATDSPYSWYRLDETAGATTAIDKGSVPVNGTYGGTFTFEQDSLVYQDDDKAVSCNGIDSILAIPNPGGVSGSLTAGGFSFECWVKAHTQVGTPGSKEFIAQPFYYAPTRQYVDAFVLYMNNSPGTAYVAALITDINANQAFATSSAAGYYIDDGLPHHIVATVTNTTLTLYIDGASRGTASTASVTGQLPNPLGWFIGGNPYDAAFVWDDSIDEVALYNTALSAARVLAHYNAGKNAASGAWGAQTTDVRIGSILDAISWPTSDRNLDTGSSTLQPTTLDVTAKEAIDKAVRSEQGALFFQQDGKIRFRARHTVLTDTIHTTSQATFGDGGGSEVPYMEIERFDYSADKVLNEVRGNRRGGPTATAIDTSSRTSYLRRVDADTLADLEVNSDLEVVDAVNWRLAHYKDPISRPLRIVVKPATSAEWVAVLQREIGHRITLNRRPPGSGTISKAVLIERIEDIVNKLGDYEFHFDVSIADTQTYWILGTSQLDTDTRVAY
jgi:hypothetical protein